MPKHAYFPSQRFPIKDGWKQILKKPILRVLSSKIRIRFQDEDPQLQERVLGSLWSGSVAQARVMPIRIHVSIPSLNVVANGLVNSTNNDNNDMWRIGLANSDKKKNVPK